MDELVKITPDKEKAKSLLKMVEITLEMIGTIDAKKFSSNIVKEYYDAIRELMITLLLLDGYKTYGEGAHKRLIEYIGQHYREFTSYEISLLHELRITRNKIAYDGFFVTEDYFNRLKPDVLGIIDKLKVILRKRLK